VEADKELLELKAKLAELEEMIAKLSFINREIKYIMEIK